MFTIVGLAASVLGRWKHDVERGLWLRGGEQKERWERAGEGEEMDEVESERAVSVLEREWQ